MTDWRRRFGWAGNSAFRNPQAPRRRAPGPAKASGALAASWDRMRIEQLMSRPVATCHTNDPLNVPARLMWEHDCGAIPVVHDDGSIAGVITDRDICMAAYTQGRSLDAIRVENVMAKQVIAAQLQHRVREVEDLMATHQIRRIPVVDDHGRPIGILSLSDLTIESVQPDTKMPNGVFQISHTLAAICEPRARRRHAA